jgi:hypothetical protein
MLLLAALGMPVVILNISSFRLVLSLNWIFVLKTNTEYMKERQMVAEYLEASLDVAAASTRWRHSSPAMQDNPDLLAAAVARDGDGGFVIRWRCSICPIR